MKAAATLLTVEDLFSVPDDGYRYELVKGEIRKMAPGNYKHGKISLSLGAALHIYVEAHDLGDVLGAETGFTLQRNPDTVRAPDISFVSKKRIPPEDQSERYGEGPPDLAVEVVSPGNDAREIQEKVRDYLKAGVRLIWIIYPRDRQVEVYDQDGNVITLKEGDELEGEEVIPGFRYPVAWLFRRKPISPPL